MNTTADASKQIKVCTGPGCKAWKSTTVLSVIWKIMRASLATKYSVCPVPCMKRCGGGVAVELPFHGELLKFREPEEAVNAFKQDYSVPLEAMSYYPSTPSECRV